MEEPPPSAPKRRPVAKRSSAAPARGRITLPGYVFRASLGEETERGRPSPPRSPLRGRGNDCRQFPTRSWFPPSARGCRSLSSARPGLRLGRGARRVGAGCLAEPDPLFLSAPLFVCLFRDASALPSRASGGARISSVRVEEAALHAARDVTTDRDVAREASEARTTIWRRRPRACDLAERHCPRHPAGRAPVLELPRVIGDTVQPGATTLTRARGADAPTSFLSERSSPWIAAFAEE